jgi:hypothetical protein
LLGEGAEFASQDLDRSWCRHADADLIAADLQDLNDDSAINHDTFILLAAQNQHGFLLLGNVRQLSKNEGHRNTRNRKTSCDGRNPLVLRVPASDGPQYPNCLDTLGPQTGVKLQFSGPGERFFVVSHLRKNRAFYAIF